MSDFEKEQKEEFSRMYNKQLFDTFKRRNGNEIKINCYCNFGYDNKKPFYLKKFKQPCNTNKHIDYITREYINDLDDKQYRTNN